MVFHWPQILWIGLVGAQLAVDMERHGKPKTGTYNFNISLIGVLMAVAVMYFGGFFNGTSP